MAVITAFELDDLVATGETAREADSAHRRLGPGADHAHALDGRQQLTNLPGQLCFGKRWRAEAQ